MLFCLAGYALQTQTWPACYTAVVGKDDTSTRRVLPNRLTISLRSAKAPKGLTPPAYNTSAVAAAGSQVRDESGRLALVCIVFRYAPFVRPCWEGCLHIRLPTAAGAQRSVPCTSRPPRKDNKGMRH
ncbi:hypothetical protein MAPG_09058 [Magnaporthiopsis poae ATCC 64411]|uniref:Uncharacterized protein n=1 Tax=Magnaporthiopsis poae (strain ATCC 64411 / 73-15) TaxID=644358 RepID=A0A0C4E8Y6_MAGP6|nr:hypothetical protein MAPG_09058 [Magnaporthiopsis poae ATCC 64411]